MSSLRVLAVSLLVGACGLRAAAAGPAALQVRTVRPGAFVFAAAQGGDGFVWLATKAGLLRHDGIAFEAAPTPAGLRGWPVALATDAGGALWVGSDKGDLGRVTPTGLQVPAGWAASRVRGLWAVRGVLWAATEVALVRIERDRATMFGPERGVPAGAIVGLHEARDGAVWVETEGGWAREDGERFIAAEPRLDRERKAALILRLAGVESSPSLPLLADRHIESMLRDRRGALWIATREGLVRVAAGEATVYTARDGLPENRVNRLFEDREGDVWAITHGGNLARVHTPAVRPLGAAQGLAGGVVFALAEARDGGVWITTPDGLTHARDGVLAHLRRDHELPHHSVRSLLLDRAGALWVTTDTSFAFRYVDRRFTRVEVGGDPGEAASAITEDADGTVWLATLRARVTRFVDGRAAGDVVPVSPACAGPVTHDRPCAAAVNTLVRRRAGGVWAGTYGGDVDEIVGGARRSVFRLGDERRRPAIRALHEDAAGALWIGGDRGLAVWRHGRLRTFGAAQSLPELPVLHILEDGAAHLWLATDRGVVRVAKAPLETGTRPDVASYTTEDGLPSEQIMGPCDPPAIRTRDGRLWFATAAGVAVFEPPESMLPPPTPILHVDQAVLSGQVFDARSLGKLLEIPPGRGDLTFRFTAPAFGAPGRMRFRWRLAGYDQAFTPPRDRRSAEYTNIPPGTYGFQVVAFDEDHARREARAEVQFRLRPRFHQTAAFPVVLIAAALGLAATAWWTRSWLARARMGAVLDERRRVARDLHDTLAQTFSALGLQVDALGRRAPQATPAEVGEALSGIRTMVGEARRAARAAVWNLRAHTGTANGLTRALEDLPRLYPDVAVAVRTEGSPHALPLTCENELLQIASQAVSNAVEHGRARQVGIDLVYERERVALWVRDDGAGFDGDVPGGTGRFGLLGMRERAERAGGRLVVESAPGVGTEIGVVIERPRRGGAA